MIETTYIPLDEAAALLDTKPVRLLIAAIEGRIRLYGLLNQHVPAEIWEPIEIKHWDEEEDYKRTPHPDDSVWIDFVPLSPFGAGCVLEGKNPTIVQLAIYKDGGCLVYAGNDALQTSSTMTFMRKEDVEEIIASKRTPETGTIREEKSPQARAAETKSQNKLLCILNAVALMAPLDINDRFTTAKIREKTDFLKTPVTDDTILKYLREIPKAVSACKKK